MHGTAGDYFAPLENNEALNPTGSKSELNKSTPTFCSQL